MENRFEIGDILDKTFRIFFTHFPKLMLIMIVCFAPVSILQYISQQRMEAGDLGLSTLLNLIFMLLSLLMSAVMQGAIVSGVHRHLTGETFELGRCVSIALNRFGPIVGISILTSILTGIGTLLLIIPGIIIYCALWISVPASVVERSNVGDSISRSWELTKGYRLRIFGVNLVMGLLYGAALLVLTTVGAVALMSSPEGAFVVFVLTALLGGVYGVLTSVLASVGYYRLRMAVEGLDLNELVEVFD